MRNRDYLLAAAIIAFTAFAIGQRLPGYGMPFAIAAMTCWVAYAIARQRKTRSLIQQ